ncbi:hypothetical protein OU798_16265 [Prolixibacteraceae bacterium Z1-6]|uniref:Uncharacterized protein n=1 Tax=Draconibacterium aestuarii TaxID=2998507 RepID=A0A9X3FF37_9BACT|nr:hypothetical protein [Prolixibacteraceae bacterium Z1-6]
MEINRNNYEAFFIDYLEGTLDERLVDSFLEFIKLNPDLKEELALFESVGAVPEDILFTKKDTLYKEKFDSEQEFNNAAIASLEGDISADEKFEFEIYLAEHPEKKKEADLFTKTKLKANESILFAKKNKLYRKSTGKIIFLWSGRVAAILILAFAIFTLVNTNNYDVIPENQLAQVEDSKEVQKENSVSEGKNEPVDEKKKVPPNKSEVTPKQEQKKADTEKKSQKSIRETTKGRLEEEEIAKVRVPVEIPSEIKTISASLNVQVPKATMGTMYLVYPEEYDNDEILLADKVKEKLNIGKITKAGLNLAISISNERFTYETDKEGKVVEYNYDSRLLAFSIPNKRNESK